MSDGIRVAAVGDVPDGEGIVIDKSVTNTDDNIALFSDGGEFFALNDTCTHAEASLADGWVEDGEVECPLHAGRFCLKTGEVLCMPATKDTIAHRLEVRDGELYLYPNTEQT
jgi:3-phenylpropionate/trans-cinnamate dioxygenase ferredoxin component